MIKKFKEYNELRLPNFLSKFSIKVLLKKFNIKNYTINSDLSIDVNGSVNLGDMLGWQAEMEYGNIEITDNKIICDNIKIFIFDDKVRIEINDFDVEHKAKTITKFSISEKNVIAYSDYEATFYIKK